VGLIEIGRLGRPHGLKGEQRLEPCTFTALELHAIKTFTWQGKDGASRTLTLATARAAHDRMLVRFTAAADRGRRRHSPTGGCWSRGRSAAARAPGPRLPASADRARGGDRGRPHGGHGGGDLAVSAPRGAAVRGAGGVLIPSIPEFVRAVDLTGRRITVRLLPGMEEGAATE
jgi:ribosomal 30S subunit maturation factor RimM